MKHKIPFFFRVSPIPRYPISQLCKFSTAKFLPGSRNFPKPTIRDVEAISRAWANVVPNVWCVGTEAGQTVRLVYKDGWVHEDWCSCRRHCRSGMRIAWLAIRETLQLLHWWMPVHCLSVTQRIVQRRNIARCHSSLAERKSNGKQWPFTKPWRV